MANLGGSAEAHARFKQYEYRANSSLLLTINSRPQDTHKPMGEPETLWCRIDKKKERDAASASADVDLPRKHRRCSSAAQREDSVLSLADDVVYKPQTKETRAAYEAMLGVIQQQFGGQPLDH